jgi:hypothetical protein
VVKDVFTFANTADGFAQLKKNFRRTRSRQRPNRIRVHRTLCH